MTKGRNTQPLSDRSRDDEPSLVTGKSSAEQFLFNRDLSLVEFFQRVLEEALDNTQPLLERLKFLSILYSNLDEFFMIRVSGLKEKLEHEEKELSPDGRTPAEQLKAIRERLLPIIAGQMRCLREEILPQLKAQDIVIAPYNTLTEDEREALNA